MLPGTTPTPDHPRAGNVVTAPTPNGKYLSLGLP